MLNNEFIAFMNRTKTLHALSEEYLKKHDDIMTEDEKETLQHVIDHLRITIAKNEAR